MEAISAIRHLAGDSLKHEDVYIELENRSNAIEVENDDVDLLPKIEDMTESELKRHYKQVYKSPSARLRIREVDGETKAERLMREKRIWEDLKKKFGTY